MKIDSIGTDIVEIDRLKQALKKRPERFLNRIFSDQEIKKLKTIANQDIRFGYLAKRFAAKEAFAKAVGYGFGSKVSHRDISVLNQDNGSPFITLDGNTLNTIKKKYNNQIKIHISIADTKRYALATVIIAS